MKKNRVKTTIALALAACVLGACTLPAQKSDGALAETETTDSGLLKQQNGNDDSDIRVQQSGDSAPQALSRPEAAGRPMLLGSSGEENEPETEKPNVEAYTVDPDLGNIDNLWQFYLQEDMADKLVQNGFVVSGSAGKEFFEIYEINRYSQVPNFVTVDSLMHTYHLYFSYLMKNIERNYLTDRLMQLSVRMLDNSTAQYDRLKGSEWEDAALRNVAFFSVGAKLLDENIEVDADAEGLVSHELDAIERAEGIEISGITGLNEDFTQYIPRGYYEGDEKLERYFKAMMWYGRIHFRQEYEELDRSALLITRALADDPEAYGLWEAVYAVTSFFAGASDDAGVCEYGPVIRKAYGGDVSLDDLAGDQEAFERFHAMTASLSAPAVNSVPIRDGEDNVILGFRFMGQRFTIDGAIMQQLVYQNVGENSQGGRRMLPDVLDVPAALGNDLALDILKEKGDTDYPGYMENMSKLREKLAEENKGLWSASLYARWLDTLRPLLTVKGEGYPMFMQGEQWAGKSLECFAGSFTELKHDTILYAKQVIAEMGGGGYEEEPDDRGYVEPEPLVYARFARLAGMTAQGLLEYGMLEPSAREDLTRLSEMARRLFTISNKELGDELLTDEEYEFIRNYGGSIEHFWYEAMKAGGASEMITSQEYPAAVVVDIATNPGGQVLEAATGNPSEIYVAVRVDGKVKLARGSVYSFYQFEWPMEDRLTDERWCRMMGISPDEEGNYYSYDTSIFRPEWTESYRYRTEWE